MDRATNYAFNIPDCGVRTSEVPDSNKGALLWPVRGIALVFSTNGRVAWSAYALTRHGP